METMEVTPGGCTHRPPPLATRPPQRPRDYVFFTNTEEPFLELQLGHPRFVSSSSHCRLPSATT